MSAPPPLQERVLSVLVEHGPVRVKDLGHWLYGIDHIALDCAMNALMRANKVSRVLGMYVLRVNGNMEPRKVKLAAPAIPDDELLDLPSALITELSDTVQSRAKALNAEPPPSAAEEAAANLTPPAPTAYCLSCEESHPQSKFARSKKGKLYTRCKASYGVMAAKGKLAAKQRREMKSEVMPSGTTQSTISVDVGAASGDNTLPLDGSSGADGDAQGAANRATPRNPAADDQRVRLPPAAFSNTPSVLAGDPTIIEPDDSGALNEESSGLDRLPPYRSLKLSEADKFIYPPGITSSNTPSGHPPVVNPQTINLSGTTVESMEQAGSAPTSARAITSLPTSPNSPGAGSSAPGRAPDPVISLEKNISNKGVVDPDNPLIPNRLGLETGSNRPVSSTLSFAAGMARAREVLLEWIADQEEQLAYARKSLEEFDRVKEMIEALVPEVLE